MSFMTAGGSSLRISLTRSSGEPLRGLRHAQRVPLPRMRWQKHAHQEPYQSHSCGKDSHRSPGGLVKA
eukprot:2466882-Prorocentrum_lima.AAC.1